MNEGVKKYAFNTSWLFSEQIIRMVVGLLVGVWVARYLGPSKFGLLNYAYSLVGLFGAIATLGLNSVVIRDIVKSKEKDVNILLGTAFFLKIIGAAITICILWVSIVLIDGDKLTSILVFIIASSTIFQSFNVIDFYFQAKVKSKFVVYTNFIVLGVASLLKVILIVTKAPLQYFAMVFLVESIILALGLFLFYKLQKNNIKNWKFRKLIAKKLLRDSWPLILSSIAVSIGMRIDQVMLKTLINEESVGYYSVGVKLAEVFNFIPVLIVQSVFPKIVGMNFNSDRKVLVLLIRYVFFALIILGLVVNTLSQFIVNLLYGPNYYPSSNVLDILIWTIPFVYLNLITIAILQTKNFNKMVLIRQATLAGLNILVNLFLIPRYGILGAAIATVFAEFSVILLGFLIPKERWVFGVRAQALLFIPEKFFTTQKKI
ncbi:flippase [Euzebyella marina]|nr:flippase [Euzebyella marina]